MNAPQDVALHERVTSAVSMPRQHFSMEPRNIDEAFRLADMLADSELVPKDFRGKPGNCMVAMQWGMEIGLKPMQALQNIAVINGRPALWGDALIALVRSSPLCEYVVESTDAAGTAVCQVKRRGEPEQVRTFGDADAKTAGLLGKQGPWVTNPKRMKQMRARAFALRDVFPDVLKGMAMAEEVMDFTETLQPSAPIRPAAPVIESLDPAVIAAARDAADKGKDAFARWWKDAKPEQRRALKDEMGDLQRRTEAADKARTVDAPPPADPASDEFVEAMERAEHGQPE